MLSSVKSPCCQGRSQMIEDTHPLPLVATTFNVVLDAGLAIVTTTRRFRNTEEASIEATITFPVPVHATLFALKARIGDRVLDAHAKRKDAARMDYEGALERGKTAVLHEEVLRGVHMLSVGHVVPGAEIEVQSSFAVALTNLNGRGALRIPLTVGDIYGRSGLPDSDDLAHGGTLPLADLAVQCPGGSAVAGREHDQLALIEPLATPLRRRLVTSPNRP